MPRQRNSENMLINGDQPVLGGQAIINGVMIKSSKGYAMAVWQGKKLVVKKVKHKAWSASGIWRLPILRGMATLVDMMAVGMKALDYSAQVSDPKAAKAQGKHEFAWAVLISLLLGIGLFIALPVFLTKLLTHDRGILFNLIDGLWRIAIFIAYLLLISTMRDIRELFQYHGAEHQAVHAYEHRLPLTEANLRSFATQHQRCGTAFLILLLILSILVFSLITSTSLWVKMLGRVILIPLIIGLSYEVIRLNVKHKDSWFMKLITIPGIWLQHITTKKPNSKQMKAAIAALNAVLQIK